MHWPTRKPTTTVYNTTHEIVLTCTAPTPLQIEAGCTYVLETQDLIDEATSVYIREQMESRFSDAKFVVLMRLHVAAQTPAA